jgi:uncharacterized protein (TIGR03086 family)
MTDVSDRYSRLANDFARRVEAVPADGWDRPSPCEGWTAKDVFDHVLGGAVGTLERAGRPVETPSAPAEAWRVASAAVVELLEDPASAETKVPGPMGEMPIEQFIGRIICSDVLVHTWDLARAVGLDDSLDADAVHHAFEGMRPMDGMIRRPGVFGPKVEPPAGADEQTEFLCFLGRPV